MPSIIFNAAARLKRKALNYIYNFDKDFNERIVERIARRFAEALDHHDNEKRLYARALAHYEAQLNLRPTISKWGFEISSIFAVPLFVIFAWFRGLLKPNAKARDIDGARLVFENRFEINPEIYGIPDELSEQTIETRELNVGHLCTRDLPALWRMFITAVRNGTRFPFQFVLKCAVDLSRVRGALHGLSTTWVIVYWEFSCALSFITAVLSKERVDIFNVMHGEKNYFAKNAFFEVTRCYCWSTYYVELFERLSARADFRIFDKPPIHLETVSVAPTTIGILTPSSAQLADSAFTSDFAGACNSIVRDYPVTVRIHPMYREDFIQLRSHLDSKIKVSDSAAESPLQFINEHPVLAGAPSTLLLDAIHAGRQVVVLDVNDGESLKDRDPAYGANNVIRTRAKNFAGGIKTAIERLKVS